ncbi:UPF0481 protein At3g47200-like [Juglans regia]|nr:UPF0481 protein At3g47200-like [Juglans regia]
MDAEGIASSIEGKLDQYLPPPPISQCSIFKVPNMLRRDNERAFTPEVVSIGPFHRNNMQLREMENNKLQYLECLLNRTGTPKLKSLVEAIDRIEQDCGDCYAEVVDLRRDKFIEMMVIDGCLILEFLYRYQEKRCVDDPVFNTSWMPRKIVADLLLLENQLPWCVLVCLFNLITTNDSTTTEYQNSLLNDLVAIPFSMEYRIFYYDEHRRNRLGTQKHLLDYFRNSIVGSPPIKRPESPPASSVHPNWIPIKSVMELLDLGVGFFPVPDGGNFLDVKFEDGKMKIPAIFIEENTECLFRNLIAFEHCDPSKGYEITSYASLLNWLIKSPEDALHLKKKDILQIIRSSNEDKASFLKLLYNNDTSFHGFLYSDLCEDVNKIYSSNWAVWRARLKREYFNEPKELANFLYGVVLSAYLSLIQTVFAILSYKASIKNA